MTAASKSACLLPRGLDRRIRTEYMDRTLRIQSCFTGVELHYSTKRKEDALIRQTQISIRCLGRERKDRKPALTRLPFVSCFRSGVAALLPILVLDFQLHSSEEEDSKSPPVVICLDWVLNLYPLSNRCTPVSSVSLARLLERLGLD
ncbi:hypothetical protein KY289_001185 [Solanum tuberosum]|nr:hypothetical protein KY289_001185 [Solanum tuberosum]